MATPVDHRENILAKLAILCKMRKKNKEVFKVKAYEKVIAAIANNQDPICTIDDLEDIPGIGKNIRQKIIEIIETGTVDEIEKITPEEHNEEAVINDLLKIYGVGEVSARQLYKVNKIRSIQELRDRATNEKLLNDKQMIGLKYYEDLNLRIPFKEMKKHDKFVAASLKETKQKKKNFTKLTYKFVGSYRRKTKDSGDIDMLITCKPKKNTNEIEAYREALRYVVEVLIDAEYIIENLALGPTKFMGICKLPDSDSNGEYLNRRIDIKVTTKEEYPFALLYFTGSKEFNVDMRRIANRMNLSLNEYNFTVLDGDNKGEVVDVNLETEEDVFNYLNINYVEPPDRDGEALDRYL